MTLARFPFLLELALVCLATSAQAQSTETPAAAPAKPAVEDVGDLSLEALLDSKVEVATRSGRAVRQTPGIISVVTREEILASGARDLLEVLQLVPGFTFHLDVQGTVGVGFRGLWGHEGKVLLLIDGIEMNELLYSTNQFGHHHLAHNIERVEVIRGPGSAIYGGFAELAVIQVITRDSKELRGAEATVRYSQGPKSYGDRSVGLSGGYALSNDLELGVSSFLGQGLRSQSVYTDGAGATADLSQTSQVDPGFITAVARWRNLRARLLYDNYRVNSADAYGDVVDPAELVTFKTIAADVVYEQAITEHLVVRPRLTARWQTPWQVPDENKSMFYDKTGSRLVGGVSLSWDPLSELNLLFGLEATWDEAWLNNLSITGLQSQFGDSDSVSYGNVAAYAQALWDNPWVNVAAGGRFELHTAYGANFAPRIGLTRQFDRLGVKLLYSGAFRSPGTENINLGADVKPERTNVAEAEASLKASDVLYLVGNVFYTNISQPIIYGYNQETDSEVYFNQRGVGATGFELEAMLRGSLGFARASYSWYTPTDNEVPAYSSGHPNSFLGFPNHKVTAQGRWRAWRGLGLGGSASYMSKRYAWIADASGTEVRSVPAELMVNLWVGYDDLYVKGLSLQLGVSNLLDTPTLFVQPYDGGHNPLPGRSREIFLRLAYHHRLAE